MTVQPTEEQLATLKAVARMYVSIDGERAPILETPNDYGMEYEDITFTAEDGTKLAAWFIPAAGSDKLIICNHPATLNRYGFPGHMKPWSDFQDVEVKFGKVHKALHDAGYNVLAYDLRNHGESESAPDNAWGQGFSDEYKDVLAAFDYAKSQDTLKDMKIGLFNPCAGGGAAIHAMSEAPQYFEDVKAFVCAQPASINIMSKVALDGLGLGEFFDIFAQEVEALRGIPLKEMSPHKFAQNITMPTYIVQNKDDVWTIPDDVQTTFDLIPGEDKKLHWIEDGDTRRFIGYNFFGDHPETMIEFFDKYVK
ncbi:S9 family peptidase [Labrenzia sp. PHM005]|uniref:alpha/beta hydrolase family protein n=1 Tax=Labrenzia sp. PHM005 TaxID=2590016 RepID=UPI00113FC634|nr:alpha/beta fold hydrolase [Labrenzia sp. PHM005]QDG78312.1 alpha/beta hydrolase [Labrenzia sp. PHM005]